MPRRSDKQNWFLHWRRLWEIEQKSFADDWQELGSNRFPVALRHLELGRSPHSRSDSSGAVVMSCNPMTQSSENQFFHWRQDMERKQEEQARKMKKLQSHVEGSQRNNDQSRTQIGESREPGKGILNKAFFKALSINLCNSPLKKPGWRSKMTCPV